MRLRCFIFFSLVLITKVCLAEDIYWEGEDDMSNEFLEVEPNDSSLSGHLQRFKRGFQEFVSSYYPVTTPPPPGNYRLRQQRQLRDDDDTFDKEDDDSDIGSGVPYILEPEIKEKTLQVTFVVNQPYHTSYSNRDSADFQSFSSSLAESVTAVLRDNVAGSHRASLVRIQSRPTDEFTCRVTLDIVTSGDTNQIVDKLHKHIKLKRKLGDFAVNDEDFSTSVSTPSTPLSSCSPSEIRCSEGRCIPSAFRCNGHEDCSDGADEKDCPFESGANDDQDENEIEEDTTDDYYSSSKSSTEDLNCPNPYLCQESSIIICQNMVCNGERDCPIGDDEVGCQSTTSTSTDETTTGENDVPVTPIETSDYETTPVVCSINEFKCDERRCIASTARCDQIRDCDDGTDEERCGDESCGVDDFRCYNNKCIEGSKRCNSIVDCAQGEDEQGCACRADEFRCEDDGSCIESRKKCDGIYHCRDRSDEVDCACSSKQWQCDHGTCIKRSKRCDGRVDCPTDRSDERNCIAVGYFRCRSGKLIPDYRRCNRQYDCDVDDYSDEQNCPCGDGDFKCDNGYCIPPLKRCDRTHDCQDGSDERDCTYGTVCMAYQYKCSSGHCVPADARCNGTAECIDLSDEKECPCKRDEFKCRDGSCINIAKRCDGRKDCLLVGEDEHNCEIQICPADRFTCDSSSAVRCATKCDGIPECDGQEDEDNCNSDCNHECDGRCLDDSKICDNNFDCNDGSDEKGCNPCDSFDDFRCGSKECINIALRCNGLKDCLDFSDEKDCDKSTTPSYGCGISQYQCADGTCINIQFRCDGNSDCIDNSDELNCSCDDGLWKCLSGQCIPDELYCDGNPDCNDNSDEENCPVPNTTPFPPPTYPPITNRPFNRDNIRLYTYPKNQTMHNGGDVVFLCRDEGDVRAPVRWVREDGRPLKPGSSDRHGRLEMFSVTDADSGVYICQAPDYLGTPGSQARVTLNVEIILTTSRPTYMVCQRDEATCSNGMCIPSTAVCNGRVDCTDGSDEETCPDSQGHCEPSDFKCDNGKCILKSWYCDAFNDCGDNSDEPNSCLLDDSRDPDQPCSPDQFACHSQTQCVPRHFQCDGQPDCIDSSDEIGCSARIIITRPPYPSNVRLSPGENLTLECEATGTPMPLISWRLNWGHVPEKCTSTSKNGVGRLFCPNMQPNEDRGAYSCEAINNKATSFATPDSIVVVERDGNLCPPGYFNSEARSESECIRCFCFGKSTNCRSANLYTFNMPTSLGEGGTRLLGVQQSYTGDVNVNKQQPITNQYYYQPLRNGAAVTKLDNFNTGWSRIDSTSDHPYLTLPETYNGNQLKSYGGHIKYRLSPHSPQRYGSNDGLADIIIVGKYQNLTYMGHGDRSREIYVEARLTAGNWQKAGSRGLVPASREDIMMALDDIKMILLRADFNNAGVNITDFVMESGQYLNAELGAASLVEECTCPEGYEGLSCQKCASGFERVTSGAWLGSCVARRECPPGTYGDPRSGGDCRPCPCPLTNRDNQFARTCAIGPYGNVICDCMTGYEGDDCSYCAEGYYGNPLLPGNSCKPKPTETCHPDGTSQIRPPDECVCKENVQGRNCDQCKTGSFFLSSDFRYGCAQCFCTGVTRECMVSNLRRETTTVRFNVPQIVDQVRLYKTALSGSFGTVRYTAPTETELHPTLLRGEMVSTDVDRSQPSIYYWSLPATFGGDKVTSYGGYLNYQLNNVASPGFGSKNNAADVQIVSLNGLTFQYFGNFFPAGDGYLNASVQFLETGWQRADGKPVTREYFLLTLADVKTILIKATYTTNAELASLMSASIDTASPSGSGPLALHVEQCRCPKEYIGTSCEDCAPGYTRTENGLYLEHCDKCKCNGHSNICHPENGDCYNCEDNTAGKSCEECIEGYYHDEYNNCVPRESSLPICNCDPRGEAQPCDRGYCACKANVEGESCDRCRNGTFGLDAKNPMGCIECYCSGVTRNCYEASHYNRLRLPAPIFEENYGGYTLMDINADQVINDQFVPVPNESELQYIFSSSPNQELYWSLPVFPGNRVLSYGGTLSLTQKFESGDDDESSPGTDIILVSDEISLYWSNPTPIRSGESLSYQVPLRVTGWYILNTETRASRYDFMSVLKNLKRVLVRATLSQNLISTSIADVSMDTAAESYDVNLPAATGVEVCICPEGYTGTSCESCTSGYYKDTSGTCSQCRCNGEDCQLDSFGTVICNCRPPRSGPDCSAFGGEVSTTYRPPPPRSTVSVRISSPTIKIQEIGSSVNFTCQARSSMTLSRLQVNWRKADGDLPLERTQFDQRTGAIIITNLQTSDSGKYVCESSDGVSTEQATATLKVPGIEMTQPTVTISSPIREYYEGDRVELKCFITGNPAPTVSWQRSSNKPLPYSLDVEDSVLVLENALVEDSGEYRCVASNAAGSAHATAIITVRANPSQPSREKLTVSKMEPSVIEGQNMQLTCTASPNVAAGTIEWVRQDGTPFLANVRSDNGVLYIDRAFAQNQGVYVCQTTSYEISPVVVVLKVIPTGTPSPNDIARITLSREQLEIPTGGSETVDCIPDGNPLPLIKWSRSPDSFGPGTSQRENTLIITNAQESDAGYYICEGVIDGNPVVRKYIYVEISRREAPRVEIYPQGENAVQLGSEFEFQCSLMAGIPSPVVTWDRSGGRPLSPHVEIQQNNRLRFQNIEVNDEGDYTCTATNEAGTSSSTASLKVRSYPEITIHPNNLVTAAIGSPVRIECRADGYPEPEVSIRARSNEYRILVPSRPRVAVLNIQRVSENDEDDYICTATSVAGTIEEQFAIRVERGDGGLIDSGEGSGEETNPSYPDGEYGPVEPGGPNTNNPSNIIAQEGQDANITCDAPREYRVQWGRADRAPLQDNARQIDTQLIIYGATKRDSGKYQCLLINQETQEVQVSAITSLLVLAPPRISLRPQTQTVRPGESTNVECVVVGDDIESVFWTPVNTRPSSRVETRNATLMFRQIEVEDAGQYKCTAKSRVAEAYGIAEVIVSEETDRVSHDNEQYAHVGAGVHLSCNLTQRSYMIGWRKNGHSLPRSVSQKSDGSLFIRHAQKSDSGNYVCIISDQRGRQTSNYINLHIEGFYCSERQFRCYDDSNCIEEALVCNGYNDCRDASDERICSHRKKKRSWTLSDPKTMVSGPRAKPTALISIDQPRGPYTVGDRVDVLCRTMSRDITATWERLGTRQYVDSRIYGDGALLIIPNIKEHDAGVYRCIGEDPEHSRSSYEDFDLQVNPGPNEPSYPVTNEDQVYTASLGESYDLPCNHNLGGRTTVEWKREYSQLPPNARTKERILSFDRVTEADAGTYICKVSNDVARVESRATLRVAGVNPKFTGDSWLALPMLKDAYTKFDIEVTFKPSDGNGVILYNGEREDGNGDFLMLELLEGVPQFTLKYESTEPVIFISGDRPLELNAWHNIRLSRSEYKVTMDVDNTGPFVAEQSKQYGILDLHEPLYIGYAPPLPDRTGFIGCVSMLLLGKEEKNIIPESIERNNVLECDSCSPNLCLNNGVCQEARNERGYMCLCAAGFAGLNCDRTGEACRPGLCGSGKCRDTTDGYKCMCPVTFTGKNCDIRQNIAYPAFTGSAYLAIKAPETSRSLRMSMKIKAKPPVTDGIIMYCAQSARGHGGFTSLTVHDGKLEFRYDLGDGNAPIVLVSNKTLPAYEWTDVRITRMGQVVSLKINMLHNYEDKLASPRELNLATPMFVGGVDDSIILNNNTGVTGGFSGCIKDVSLHGDQLDLINATIQSANIQECVNNDRGDIPETESICSQCRNNGYCAHPDATACTCGVGFTGLYCETRVPMPNIMRPARDPCAVSPCVNGGTCKIDRSSRMNYTCDCILGYAGTNCQMPLDLLQSVGFNGNGYLELPLHYMNYDTLDIEPALVALAFHTNDDGVLMFQNEARVRDGGDYVMLRVDRGVVVMDWDTGSAQNSISINIPVTDGERHLVVARIFEDSHVELMVDGVSQNGTNSGISSVMNADSNIYIGGIPESLNSQYNYPGFNGCIEQVEFNNHRSINLGSNAVAGRNTQKCKDVR